MKFSDDFQLPDYSFLMEKARINWNMSPELKIFGQGRSEMDLIHETILSRK